jgi:hypothetical protein
MNSVPEYAYNLSRIMNRLASQTGAAWRPRALRWEPLRETRLLLMQPLEQVGETRSEDRHENARDFMKVDLY